MSKTIQPIPRSADKRVTATMLGLTTLLCGPAGVACAVDDDEQDERDGLESSFSLDLVALDNPSFENGWRGWSDDDPSAISGDARTGSKSAKVSGPGGEFRQLVPIDPNTRYVFSAYVKGTGTVGVRINGRDKSKSIVSNSWQRVAIGIHSGSAQSMTLYGSYAGGIGRFDDFALDRRSQAPADDPPPPPGPAQVPSDVLDMSAWQLTLPIPERGDNDNPLDIFVPELRSFEAANLFFVNRAGDGVVFRTPVGGTTTRGSSYPRSELREMVRGYSGRSPRASWSTTRGRHTMYIKQSINRVPPEKPHVVAGQIHDSDDDLIVVRLEGERLFIDLNGDDGPTLRSRYRLGDVFEVKLDAHDGVVDVYFDDMDRVFWTYDSRSARASGCYFKAGAYPQSNPDRGDSPSAVGEVEIFDLRVTHEP